MFVLWFVLHKLEAAKLNIPLARQNALFLVVTLKHALVPIVVFVKVIPDCVRVVLASVLFLVLVCHFAHKQIYR